MKGLVRVPDPQLAFYIYPETKHLRDIEHSLTESSIYHFPYETLFDIFNPSFPEYHIPEFTQEALYAFSCKTTSLTYDGIIHLHCPLLQKSTKQLISNY